MKIYRVQKMQFYPVTKWKDLGDFKSYQKALDLVKKTDNLTDTRILKLKY